ncbi:MAG: DNA-binding protein [Propionivibrio sp.]|jgi:predicted DNA-binding protein with PD1-like motif|nr:DNA-binding protein [Propionivibrio sp.]
MDKAFWYKEYSQGRRFFLKILPGQSLKANIRNLVIQEKIKVAVILSAIGSIRNVRINGIKSGAKLPITAARLTPHELEGPLELLGLSGNIVPGADGQPDCHLHLMAGKASGDVVGGQLDDAEVFATCEIVLVEVVLEGVERHKSSSGGTSTIYFAEE